MSKSSKCVVIGIAGASASGKSLFAKSVYQEVSDEIGAGCISVISEDCYYKDQSNMSMAQRVRTNYDHPQSMDHALLVEHLKLLKSGTAIEMPQYSYTEHTRLPTTKHLGPTRVILLEGILLFTDEAIRSQMDASIFMDTPLDICLARRIERDVRERGRKLESVLAQYHLTVRPMFKQFIEPSKQYADVIIPRGGKNRIAIDIIKTRIRHLLAQSEEKH
ncbi:uridine kinase [Celerinatantimonas diazotrophica]|uniref:Uridine kinase n=1 Tax=Celerinatantimonas diazotrophica TaxID=412034 RepID=A0A4R1J958_9GAMM|nr:uridine kinase [Celerinatantimonas diazotrophica]TCK46615.1 uridine kinase [Celerinatantimonas diazotrophica]CAG9296665.1 Uridine kinase [Celerinatantimonas diazotrophica]